MPTERGMTEEIEQEGRTQDPPRPVWDPATGTWQDPGAERTEILSPVVSPPPGRHSAGRAGIAGGLVGAVVAAVVAYGVVQLRPAGPVIERREAPSAAAARKDASSIVGIATKARPWVVNVNVSGRRRGIFGTQQVQGTGSGVILRSDGHIITNAHVAEAAQNVEVTLASGETVQARVVGTDPDTDVAVIKAEKSDLPSAVIGSAKDLQVGELAVAIGSPLGLRQTVTAGIVSALGRTVERQGRPALVDMIQTDAAITSGNSGGALLNAIGSLVGINTAIAASPEVGAEGIAFAIPIDIAKAVADELIATGKATHPWLGIAGANIDDEIAQRFGVSEGAVIEGVQPGSPADKAGLKEGDIIVALDGKKIASMDELVVALRSRKVGQAVKVEVVRGGQRMTLDATLGDRPRA